MQVTVDNRTTKKHETIEITGHSSYRNVQRQVKNYYKEVKGIDITILNASFFQTENRWIVSFKEVETPTKQE